MVSAITPCSLRTYLPVIRPLTKAGERRNYYQGQKMNDTSIDKSPLPKRVDLTVIK